MATHHLAPKLNGSALILSSTTVTLPSGFDSMAASTQGRSPSSAMENTGSGSTLQQPLLSPRASSLQHVEVMERLKQLMAWQERQKASLLKQQQEQIMQLHQQHQVSEQQWEMENGELCTIKGVEIKFEASACSVILFCRPSGPCNL